MKLYLPRELGGEVMPGYDGSQDRLIVQGHHQADPELAVAAIARMLDLYRERTDHVVDFRPLEAPIDELGSGIERETSGILEITLGKKNKVPVGVLQILALGYYQGTGEFSDSSYDRIVADYILSEKAPPADDLLMPVSKEEVHTEAYVPLARVTAGRSVRNRQHWWKPLPMGPQVKTFEGGVDLIGYVRSDDPNATHIARIASLHAANHSAPQSTSPAIVSAMPHVVVTTSYLDSLNFYNNDPKDAKRFADHSAYFNPRDNIEIFGVAKFYTPIGVTVLRLLRAVNPKDRNPANLDFRLAA